MDEFHGFCLDFNREQTIGKPDQHIFKGRDLDSFSSLRENAFARGIKIEARIESFEFVIEMVRYVAVPVGGPIQLGIVDHNGNAVLCELQIKFNHIRVKLIKSQREGFKGVFRQIDGSAAVSNYKRCGSSHKLSFGFKMLRNVTEGCKHFFNLNFL